MKEFVGADKDGSYGRSHMQDLMGLVRLVAGSARRVIPNDFDRGGVDRLTDYSLLQKGV
jgi:hypothetical protein